MLMLLSAVLLTAGVGLWALDAAGVIFPAFGSAGTFRLSVVLLFLGIVALGRAVRQRG